MKNLFLSILFAILISSVTIAQVQIDRQLQMTGTPNSDRQVTGVGDPSANDHAVNVNTVQRNSVIYAADAGAANAYSVTLSPAPSYSSYPTGMVVHFKAVNANTTGSTLSVNGITSAPIVKNYNQPLVANDIKAGQMVSVIYDGANFQMLSQLGNAGGASTPTCPSGFTSVNASYCIETNERTAATYVTAFNTCGNIAAGAHMCSLGEWFNACSNTSGLVGMTNNFEWVDEMDSNGQNNFSYAKALVIGSPACTNMNINNSGVTSTNAYRCCFSK